jgi:hypothetical protein
MSENQQALEQAYQLIEAGQLGKARGMLEGILAQNQNSADAWWLYAHAIEDPSQAVTALENVVRLDPDNSEAKALLQTARQQAGVASPSSDDDFDIDFDDEALAPVTSEEPDDTRRRSLVIFGAIVGLVALGLIILIASPRGGTDQPSTTATGTFISQSVDQSDAQTATAMSISIMPNPTSTDTPTQSDIILTATAQANIGIPTVFNTDVIIMPSETPITEQIFATATPNVSVDAFLQALSREYPTNGTTQTVDTTLGTTLLVPMCTQRGTEHNQLIPRAMIGLSNYITQLPPDYMGVGVRFLDCTNNETINVMIMPSLSALEYHNADLSEQDFRRSWRVVDA